MATYTAIWNAPQRRQGALATAAVLIAAFALPAKAYAIEERDKILPIRLTCPERHGGVLELTSKSLIGLEQRFRPHFHGDKVTLIEIHLREPPYDAWEEDFIGDPLNPRSEKDKVITGKGLKLANKIFARACHGNASDKERFERALQESRALVGEVGGPPAQP